MGIISENIELCLKRIGLTKDVLDEDKNYKLLEKVYKSCFLQIPFENLDLLNKSLPSLEEKDLYQKIVVKNRGGLCFETNGFAKYLLSALGFGVTDVMGRFFPDKFYNEPMLRHRVLIVNTLDGDYLFDIGIGIDLAPKKLIKLVLNVHQKISDKIYKLEKDEDYGYILYVKKIDSDFMPLISFTTIKVFDVDFIPSLYWCLYDENAIFHKIKLVAKTLKNGRYTIDDNEFRIHKSNGEVLTTVLDEENFTTILKEYFGIVI